MSETIVEALNKLAIKLGAEPEEADSENITEAIDNITEIVPEGGGALVLS